MWLIVLGIAIVVLPWALVRIMERFSHTVPATDREPISARQQAFWTRMISWWRMANWGAIPLAATVALCFTPYPMWDAALALILAGILVLIVPLPLFLLALRGRNEFAQVRQHIERMTGRSVIRVLWFYVAGILVLIAYGVTHVFG